MSEESIQRYVRRAPLAISGKGGHLTTLKVARTLYNGFGLSYDGVVRWLGIYNERLTDSWTDGELAHKAEAAEEGDYDMPRGWKLSESRGATPLAFTIRRTIPQETTPRPAKRYVLTPNTTDVFYSHSFIRARTHAQGPGEPEISVVLVGRRSIRELESVAVPGKPALREHETLSRHCDHLISQALADFTISS
jgi:hypothetical protein